MTVIAVWSHLIIRFCTPLLRPQTYRNLANFAPKHTLNNPIMQPKFSEGQDQSQVLANLKDLVQNNGWQLDEEQIGIQKTYHLRTYTNVIVRDSTDCYDRVNIHRTFTIWLEWEASPKTTTR